MSLSNAVKQARYALRDLLSNRKVKWSLVAVTVALPAGIAVYQHAPIVKIGEHSTTYTYADIGEYYSFSRKVAEVSRKRDNRQQITRSSAFKSLLLAGIENEILAARKVPALDQAKAIEYVMSQSNVAGLLEEEREAIGDERFYHLFVRPVMVDRDFLQHYLSKDPKRQVADAAFKAAQSGGLPAGAEKAGVQVARIAAPITPDTTQFAVDAKKSIGTVMTKIVEDGNGYMIVQPVEVTDSHIIADAVIISRQPVNEFISSELSELKIPVKDRFYSSYRAADLTNRGKIFGDAKADKEQEAKKK